MTGPRRLRLLALVAALLIAVTVTAGATMDHTLVYYRTPSELARPAGQERIRLGGTVVPGSVHRLRLGVRFRLTDGRATVPVTSSAAPPQTFRQGQDAVVEGVLRPDGVFRADRVLAKHSNSYRAAR